MFIKRDLLYKSQPLDNNLNSSLLEIGINSSSDLGSYDDYDYVYNPNGPFPNEIPQIPISDIIPKVVFTIIVVVVAIIGNSMVIFVVIKNKRMWTTTNFYIMNLAVSDLLVTLCCTWVHTLDKVMIRWVLGDVFCKVNSFAQVLAVVSSTLTLMLIACDRFFGIVFALKAHMTERRASVFIILIWVFSIACAVPILVYRKVTYRNWTNFKEAWCDEYFPKTTVYHPKYGAYSIYPGKTVYYTFVTLVLFFIPFMVMTVAYAVIIWRLWSSRIPGERVDVNSTQSVQDKLRKRVVIMLIIILSVFFICWLPVMATIVTSIYWPKYSLSKPLQFFAEFLAFSNSALNPLIYAGFNENFKKGFQDALKCFNCRKTDRRRWNSIEMRHDTCNTSVMLSNTIDSTTIQNSTKV